MCGMRTDWLGVCDSLMLRASTALQLSILVLSMSLSVNLSPRNFLTTILYKLISSVHDTYLAHYNLLNYIITTFLFRRSWIRSVRRLTGCESKRTGFDDHHIGHFIFLSVPITGLKPQQMGTVGPYPHTLLVSLRLVLKSRSGESSPSLLCSPIRLQGAVLRHVS
jgi:hypothetical protein